MKRFAESLQRARAGVIWLVLLPIRAYSRVLSPVLPARCKYYPTCSAYAEEALRTHGVIRGGALAAWRVMRCNPFSHGGVDEVPPPRSRHSAHGTHA
ncbi:MAG: membrane protein insertion efficiency factor YidD [Solirubrobacterales bacterium]